jgi:outer membrane protein
MPKIWILLALALPAFAEVHMLTLKQAIDRALTQNPEVTMARLDEAKASQGIRVAHDPFTPHIGMGSGLAYSNGFPLSIEGSAPAVIQAKATQSLFNKPQTLAVAQAKEAARGAGFAAGEKSDEIAFRVASFYLDADRSARLAETAGKQVESLERVLLTAQARVDEGRELQVVAQEANVNLLRARQRLAVLESDRDYAERSLAASLGYDSGDTVRPVAEERAPFRIPDNEQAALQAAFTASKELKRLESNYAAKTLEIRADKSQRLPRIELIAQYALLAKYSNYDQYFSKFQRNNGQIGASIQVPLMLGGGAGATTAQAETDQQHIRAEMQVARSRLSLDMHQSYQDIEKSELARQVAQADLDLARSQLSILLAQMNEGRASLRQVEEARFVENEKWIAFYDAQFNSERARLNVLRQTGELQAELH